MIIRLDGRTFVVEVICLVPFLHYRWQCLEAREEEKKYVCSHFYELQIMKQRQRGGRKFNAHLL